MNTLAGSSIVAPSISEVIKINRDVAHAWHAADVPVFPCSPDNKHPRVKNWRNTRQQASTFLKLWNRPEPYLSGIDCESMHLVVIDCDVRNGVNGIDHFKRLCTQRGIILEGVPYASTPSGGRHYYFRQPDGSPIKNSAGRLAPGVDVRGVGGFVIAPGSILPDGRKYMPATGTLPDFISLIATGQCGERTLAPMSQRLAYLIRHPQALHALVDPDQAAASKIVRLPVKVGQGTDLNAALSAGIRVPWNLDNAVAEISSAQEGTRNDTLNRHAFIASLQIAKGRCTEDEVRKAFASAALAVGLDETEVATTLDSAISAGIDAADSNSASRAGMGSARADFDRTEGGRLKPTLRNAKLAITSLGITAKRDTFRDEIILGGDQLPEQYVGRLTNHAETFLRNEVLHQFGFDPGPEHIHDGLSGLAEESRLNPVTDWLDALSWDGQPRLANWLPAITGADDTKLNRWAGYTLILGMATRAYYPGTKVDTCVVLEGRQGCRKSSLAKALAGEEYFTDAPGLLALDPKSRAELLAGRWVVELGELSGLHKSEVENVKAFISQTSDHYRPAYARVAIARPRTCILIGTTNSYAYLTDVTGNRRFVPVRCGSLIDVDAFAQQREQIFAEAVHFLANAVGRALTAGHIIRRGHPLPSVVTTLLTLPKDLQQVAEDLAEERRAVDPGEDILREIIVRMEATQGGPLLPDGRRFLPSAELTRALRSELPIVVAGRTLSAWMDRLGWERHKYGRGSDQVRGYVRKK